MVISTDHRSSLANGVVAQWASRRLGDLCSPRRELIEPSRDGLNRYVGLEHLDPGFARLRRWGTDAGLRSTKARFRPGDVLYGKLRPYLGKAALAEWEGVCSTDILVLEPKPGETDPAFLSFLLHSPDFLAHAVATTSGVNHPRTDWNSIAAFEQLIPVPTEQHAIAGVLSKLQAALEMQDRIVESLKELKAATMAKLFRDGFPREPAKRRVTPFGEVPKHWKDGVLSNYAEIQTGVAKGRKIANGQLVELPYLRVANVQDGYLDLSEIKTIALAEREIPRYLLHDGDVLLTEGGDFDKLGRGYLWSGQIPNCVHQNHIFAVRSDRTALLPEFFAYQAQSHYGKSYFLRVAHKTTNLACINATKLRSFPLLIPELSEQRQIASLLRRIDEVLEAHGKKLGCLVTAFSLTLRLLMTGQVRVRRSMDVGSP